ncbi:MAG: ABC transporter permease [Proteobacteria bacterium]|nr:ABC transporter permease [Pseudomonadota bacterium]
MIRQLLVKKVTHLASIVLSISVISFMLVSVSPIDPVRAYIGADMLAISRAQKEKIEERWGINEPMHVRYVKWFTELLHGNLGHSFIFNQKVTKVISTRFATSLWLMAAAWVISGMLGFVMGIVSGVMHGTFVDKLIRFYAYMLASTPTFWMGMLLLICFSMWLGWTPICCATPPGILLENVTFGQRIYHLILPAATLSIIGIANITLHTRQKLIDVLQSDFILFAISQGETIWGATRHHGIRNIILPAITIQFASFSELFGGSLLAETVFAYPGLGQATVLAGLKSDVPLLLGIVLFSVFFVFTGNTIADLIYTLVDPRIKAGAPK